MQTDILSHLGEAQHVLEVAIGDLEDRSRDWKMRSDSFFGRCNELTQKTVNLKSAIHTRDAKIERLEKEIKEHAREHRSLSFQNIQQKAVQRPLSRSSLPLSFPPLPHSHKHLH